MAIFEREKFTEDRISSLRQRLSETTALVDGKACIYATGSYGRADASSHSDLDAFIIGLDDDTKEDKEGFKKSKLTSLEEIRVKADLIRAVEVLGLPEFDGEGKYLHHYSISQLIRFLGEPEDDFTNTFTARLLILLEGRPLVGEKIHSEICETIITKYWRDADDFPDTFIPGFLANDILRFMEDILH